MITSSAPAPRTHPDLEVLPEAPSPTRPGLSSARDRKQGAGTVQYPSGPPGAVGRRFQAPAGAAGRRFQVPAGKTRNCPPGAAAGLAAQACPAPGNSAPLPTGNSRDKTPAMQIGR